ncbi:MAG: F0F1 ATP synthase subunit alpha, partial [Planctomycetota bacterium]
ALLLAVTQGVLDELSLEQIPEFESRLRRRLEELPPPAVKSILARQPLSDDARHQLLELTRQIAAELSG